MGNACPSSGKDKERTKAKYLPDLRPSVQLSSEPAVNGHHNGSSPKEDHVPTPKVKPLPVPITKNRVRALYNFEAINEDDLSFKRGDILEVENVTTDSEDWWLAVHCKTHKKGYIPSNYVMREGTTAETQDWWFEYDRKESDKMLLLPGNLQGTFLVRESADNMSYVLSVRDSDKANGEPCVKHYRIRRLDNNEGYYITAKRTFETLMDAIEHYRDNSDGLCCKLTTACPRIRPVVQFRDLEITRDVIKLTNKLGAGCFGEVWKGTLRKVVDVAVKTLKPGTMSSEAFLNEAKIMHKLIHPKLVQLMAVVSVAEPFYIITELMVNGALLDFLRSDQGKKLKFHMLVEMNSQVAEGMTYLETVNFIHRDLRAANILVGEHYNVKVADFGLARILETDDVYNANDEAKFPIKWTAPEAALERRFSIKSDVWSFGVLMYEVVSFGKVPYPGMSGAEVLQMVHKGHRMAKPTGNMFEVPDSYYDKMLKCWHKNPEDRPTFESLWNFFDDYFVSVEPNYKDMDEM